MYELLKVTTRDSKQTGRPNQMRRSGLIPGVIFGKGINSVSIKVTEKDLMKCLANCGQILEVELDNKVKHLVNLFEVQKDAFSKHILHVSFHKLEQGKKTTVSVPIVLIGTAAGVKDGGVVVQPMKEVELTALPQDIPEALEVDISGLTLEAPIHLNDVKPPKGTEFSKDDLEQIVASCSLPRAEKEEVEAPAAAEGETATPAEGEGAEKSTEEEKNS